MLLAASLAIGAVVAPIIVYFTPTRDVDALDAYVDLEDTDA